MKVITLYFDDKERFDTAINEAVKFLKAGKVIVYPTDTTYAMGCNGTNKEAVEKIIKIKDIYRSKPFSVIIRSIEDAKEYADFNERKEEIMRRFFPGPYTFILHKLNKVPGIETGSSMTVGVRIPDNIVTQKISNKFGTPIVTTSINTSENISMNDPFKIVDFYRNRGLHPDLILDGGKIKEIKPSTVIDLTAKNPKIIRTGIKSTQETLELLEKLQ